MTTMTAGAADSRVRRDGVGCGGGARQRHWQQGSAGVVKPLKLTMAIGAYDFSKEPLFSANIVITEDGRVCKDRHGKAGRKATPEELATAEEIGPNR